MWGLRYLGLLLRKINVATDGTVFMPPMLLRRTLTVQTARSLVLTRGAFLLCRARGVSIVEARIKRVWRSKRVMGLCASSRICPAERFRS